MLPAARENNWQVRSAEHVDEKRGKENDEEGRESIKATPKFAFAPAHGHFSPQLVKQGLSLLKIARVEAFGEPAIDRGEKIAGLIAFALIAPEPRHAHRGAQLP